MNLRQANKELWSLLTRLRRIGHDFAPDLGMRLDRTDYTDYQVTMFRGRRRKMLLSMAEDRGWWVFDWHVRAIVAPPQTPDQISDEVLRRNVGVVYAIMTLSKRDVTFSFPESPRCRAVMGLVAVPKTEPEEEP